MWRSGEVVIQITSSGGIQGQIQEEAIWITSSGGHVNFEFLKITAPIVFNQRFEPGNLGSVSKGSSTAPSWDLYVEMGTM